MENSEKKDEAKKIFWMAVPLDWPFSPKIVYLTSLDEGFFRAYFLLLCMSAKTKGALKLDGRTPYTPETVAPVIGFGNDARRARRLLAALDRANLRTVEEDGGWRFSDGEKFSQSKSQNAIRVEEFRERQKSKGGRGDEKQKSPQNQNEEDKKPITEMLQSNTNVTQEKRGCNGAVPLNGFPPSLHTSVFVNLSHAQGQSHLPPSMPTPSNGSAAPGEDGEEEDDLPQANYQQLTAAQKKAAKAIKRLPYPKPVAFGMLDSVYGWVAKNDPTESDVASMRGFLEKCLRSPDWQKRLADSPDGRYLPSLMNFLRGWSSNASIQEILAYQTPEDKERQEKVASEVDEVEKAKDLDDSELLAMEAAGQLKSGDVRFLELAKRRSVGLIPPLGGKPAERRPSPAPFRIPDAKKF